MTGAGTTCVFCQIVAGGGDAHRIAENRHALAILDLQPFSPGHTVVLSRRHVPPRQAESQEEAAHRTRGPGSAFRVW
jgi:histidine triad (HIT) family protein